MQVVLNPGSLSLRRRFHRYFASYRQSGLPRLFHQRYGRVPLRLKEPPLSDVVTRFHLFAGGMKVDIDCGKVSDEIQLFVH